MGPNPRLVRMFLREKGLDIPMVEVDLMGGENRKEAFLEKNPAGQLPALELDNGQVIAEVTAICEYLEEIQPEPVLIGKTPEERAETRMWTRRIDLNIVEPMSNGFRYAEGIQIFENRIHCLPDAADGLKVVAQKGLEKLDQLMLDKEFVAGNRFTLADIFLFGHLDFFSKVGQPLNPEFEAINAWFGRMSERPSAIASQ